MRIPRSPGRFLRRAPEQPEPETPPAAVEPPPEPTVVEVARPAPESVQEPVLELAPPPPPEPEPQPDPEPAPAPAVVPLVLRDQTPRSWNLWELERLAEGPRAREVAEERTLLLRHMRQFADASGDLPVEFDALIRDTFGDDLALLTR